MLPLLGVTPQPLYYISAITGFVMVVGGMWLIFKEKIYIDRETKTVTEIETPFGFKFKTNIPALLLFVIGFIPIFYPIVKSAESITEVQFRGEVKPQTYPKNSSIDVYAVVSFDTIKNPSSFTLPVPFLGNNYKYKVLYVVGPVLQQQEFLLPSKNDYNLTVPDFSQINTTTFVPSSVAEKPAGFE